MGNIKKIKIVKKADAEVLRSTSRRRKKKQPKLGRQMIENVTTWVTDLKDRNAPDARVAFDALFGSVPEPTET